MKRIAYWVMALWFWIMPFHLFAQGTAHFNTLNWTASTTSGVTSQNVYRSTVSGGPYTLLGTIQNGTVTTFKDTQVTAGTKHCYVVTALVLTSESGFSGEACTTDVGTNVNPQTGVGVTSQ